MIADHLDRLVLRDAIASEIATRTPGFVDAVCVGDDRSRLERALEVQILIERAIDALGGDQARALTVFLGLEAGYRRTKVGVRVTAASEILRKPNSVHMDRESDKFRQKRFRQAYLQDLAVKIYELLYLSK